MRACVEWDANLPLAVIARAIHADAGRPVEAGESCVFDLGYYDYGIKARYCTPCYLSASAELDAAGCRIVTRFKSNTPPRTIENRPVAKDGAILSHRVEYRLVRQPKNRKELLSRPGPRSARARRNAHQGFDKGEARLAVVFPSNRANKPYCTYREAIPTLSPSAQPL